MNNPDFSGKTVLVAEDNELNFIFMDRMLEPTNVYIIRANNGQEAIDICRDNTNIDLVLMDIEMPVVNGYEATKEIRKFNSELIILAQTAYVFSDEKELSIQAGCNAYITKPIHIQSLMNTLDKYLNQQ